MPLFSTDCLSFIAYLGRAPQVR